MRIRTASDLMYTTIVWFPILAVVIGALFVMVSGMVELERISFGTEWFVGNDETANRFTPLGGVTNEELLLDAVNSGDPATMQAALDQVERQQAALAAR